MKTKFLLIISIASTILIVKPGTSPLLKWPSLRVLSSKSVLSFSSIIVPENVMNPATLLSISFFYISYVILELIIAIFPAAFFISSSVVVLKYIKSYSFSSRLPDIP